MTQLNEILMASRSAALRGDDYVTLVRRAADPILELGRFRDRLLSRLRGRQHELGGVTNERLQFAADTLTRARIRAAQGHLKRSMVDPSVLTEFLGYSSDIAVQAMAAAESADELAEALLDALDGVHTYLLAHELVGRGYEEAEGALARRLLESRPREHSDYSMAQEHTGERSAAAAAQNELALVA